MAGNNGQGDTVDVPFVHEVSTGRVPLNLILIELIYDHEVGPYVCTGPATIRSPDGLALTVVP